MTVLTYQLARLRQAQAQGIPIVEHLTRLGAIPEGARTFVVPLAIHTAPSVPVRAFALHREEQENTR